MDTATHDAERIVEQYGAESIVAAGTIPEFVREMESREPVERMCRVFGCTEPGVGKRQLCGEHEKDVKTSNCEIPHCGEGAKGFLNIA